MVVDKHNSGDMDVKNHKAIRQWPWLLPIVLGSLGVAVLCWKNESWGADAAAVVSVPINVAAVVVPILIERGFFRSKPRLSWLEGSRRIKISALFAVISLFTSGAIWWFTREEDPFKFLSGEVRIGYLAHDYPGWHQLENGLHVGFDAEIAEAISRHFGASVKWVPLGNLRNREAALQGTWTIPVSEGGTGKPQEPVKLVISNYSITPQRAEMIDFVGPYFVDAQGFLARKPITSLSDIPPGRVCVLAGSTSDAKLTNKQWRPVERMSTNRCIQDLKAGVVDAVSTDRSILQGLAKDEGLPPPIDLRFGAEYYGIGIPNNMPKLCREIRDNILQDFLDYEWDNVYRMTLGVQGIDRGKPLTLDNCEAAAPWFKS